MYRCFVVNVPSVYCPNWPCDRQCGLLHLPLLKITVTNDKTSTSVDVSTDSGRPSTTGLSGDFEEIMTRAGQKVSVSYTEPPLPPSLIIPDTGSKDEGKLSPHVPQDTTFLFWEEEGESQDSEENGIVFGDPPTCLDTESTLSDLLIRNRHDPDANPIFHDRIDSRIDSEEDDFDYSKLDVVPPRLSSRDNSLTPSVVSNQLNKAKRWRRTHYEPSLDMVS